MDTAGASGSPTPTKLAQAIKGNGAHAGDAETAAPVEQPKPTTPREFAQSETPWDELHNDAKIERMRIAYRRLDQAYGELVQLAQKLMRHQHLPNGGLAQPMDFASKPHNHPDITDPKAWL